MTAGGFDAVVDCYAKLGDPYVEALSDMVAFDALICNTDRHLNNFGFLVNSHNNEIVGPAPLFDHGNFLFHQGFGDDWLDDDRLSSYADALAPCLYDDFFATAKSLMTHETRSKVRGMLEFSFKYGAVKGFDKHRLKLIESQIRMRAKRLLD